MGHENKMQCCCSHRASFTNAFCAKEAWQNIEEVESSPISSNQSCTKFKNLLAGVLRYWKSFARSTFRNKDIKKNFKKCKFDIILPVYADSNKR